MQNATKAARYGGRSEVEIEADRWDSQATMSARQDEEFRREMEQIHEDAVRTCILAGNPSSLRQLDSGDPYETEEQR